MREEALLFSPFLSILPVLRCSTLDLQSCGSCQRTASLLRYTYLSGGVALFFFFFFLAIER